MDCYLLDELSAYRKLGGIKEINGVFNELLLFGGMPQIRNISAELERLKEANSELTKDKESLQNHIREMGASLSKVMDQRDAAYAECVELQDGAGTGALKNAIQNLVDGLNKVTIERDSSRAAAKAHGARADELQGRLDEMVKLNRDILDSKVLLLKRLRDVKAEVKELENRLGSSVSAANEKIKSLEESRSSAYGQGHIDGVGAGYGQGRRDGQASAQAGSAIALNSLKNEIKALREGIIKESAAKLSDQLDHSRAVGYGQGKRGGHPDGYAEGKRDAQQQAADKIKELRQEIVDNRAKYNELLRQAGQLKLDNASLVESNTRLRNELTATSTKYEFLRTEMAWMLVRLNSFWDVVAGLNISPASKGDALDFVGMLRGRLKALLKEEK